MSEQQIEFPSRPSWRVPPGDFARPGLVDAGFVERSVVAIRNMPDAEQQLRADMEARIESIPAIDLVYREELNEWAASTRERLWLEYFTAEAILNRLTTPAGGTCRKTSETTPSAAIS